MPTYPTSTPPASATPSGGLGDARLHQVIGYQIAQAAIVTYGLFERVVGAPLGLRPVEYTILMLVKENPGGSPAQLSDALSVTRPNISLWIDKLEARGLVSREKNISDRRGQHLHATAKGEALALEATRALAEGESAAYDTLSPVEQLMLTELLHKLACARFSEPTTAPSGSEDGDTTVDPPTIAVKVPRRRRSSAATRSSPSEPAL